jgi:hypothetical protein
MRFRLVAQLAAEGYEVALVCRVLEVSRSGYYEWRNRPPSERDVDDAHLGDLLREVHRDSRCSYGAPRAHKELRLGLGIPVGRKRVARLMRLHGLAGIGGARKQRRRRPAAAVHDDLVARQFRAEEPNRLWCTDVTEHPTPEGKVYCCAVLDVFSRVVVGWSIDDHMRSELVVDALHMATWRRKPEPGAIVHADRGSQGEFNRSSQHLPDLEVADDEASAAGGSSVEAGDAFAGSADPGQTRGARVLAPDRAGKEQRGRVDRGRRVRAGRDPLVSPRWRHAASEPGRADRPLPVLQRARGHRPAQGQGPRRSCDRP